MTELQKIEKLQSVIKQQSILIRNLNEHDQQLNFELDKQAKNVQNQLLFNDVQEIFLNLLLLINDFRDNILTLLDNISANKFNRETIVDYLDNFVSKYQKLFDINEFNKEQIKNFLIKELKK